MGRISAGMRRPARCFVLLRYLVLVVSQAYTPFNSLLMGYVNAEEAKERLGSEGERVVPNIRITKDPNSETMDVTMQEYGHKLAFHVIHPTYDEEGKEILDDGDDDESDYDNSVVHDSNLVDGLTTATSVDEGDKLPSSVPTPTPDAEVNGSESNLPIQSNDDGSNKVNSSNSKKTGGGVSTRKCVSWRQTGGCSPDGPRESDSDKGCDEVIHSGASGFCECEDGRHAGESSCDHDSFTCENTCTGSHKPIPLEYQDVATAFAHDKLFTEMKGSNVNNMLAKQKPFFLVILCDCPADLRVPLERNEGNPSESSGAVISDIREAWPLGKFHELVRDGNAVQDFAFVYVLPPAARQFQLYSQYSVSVDRPWVLIDNIPHGAMNEKFRGPKVPGVTAEELMDTIKAFKEYRLPLLVRSQPVPDAGKIAGSGRVLRGARPTSHVVQVVADTFKEVVLDTTRACFLLIYSPNCPASRSVIPIMEEVAVKHKEMENVTIARIDLTSNDLPIRDLIVHHYPTAYLFPSGEGDPRSHHPEYSKPLNFANYHGENTKHDVSKPHAHWSVHTISHFIEHEVMPEMEALLEDE